MSADWSQLLASTEYLGELYDGAPPPTGECDLFYVHIDEREDSVTLGFDTRAFPVNPPPEWRGQGKDLNAFEFHLLFTGVTVLRVTGWGACEAKAIDLTARDGGHFDVALGSEASGITFRAAAARLTRTRAYLASNNP
ncbi:Imm50 family immunity protein [Streptomyces sp. NPDC002156]